MLCLRRQFASTPSASHQWLLSWRGAGSPDPTEEPLVIVIAAWVVLVAWPAADAAGENE